MPTKRRFLLAAVALTAPAVAFADGDAVADAEIAVTRAVEGAVAEAVMDAVPAEEADLPDPWLPVDISVCEVTTANTKGPSYDSHCLAKLNR